MGFVIQHMKESDIDGLKKSFSNMNNQLDQYEIFWKEHQAGRRVTILAISDEQIVGYANLLWQSDYSAFQEMDIPEINNMHVLDEFQKQGVGTALIREAESVAVAQGKKEIGIGFGLTPNYGAAQRLYPKLGYIPDGRGAQSTPW